MKRLIGFLAVLSVVFLSGSVFAQEKVYKIGYKGPAGGFVFFDKGYVSNGWRYLEAAPGDEVNRSVWSNVEETKLGTTKIGIGEGKANTKAIISQPGHKESAAKLCDELEVVYNNKTFSDYFLPSRDELNLMYKNLYRNSVHGFSEYSYGWSSSELYDFDAWAQYFIGGDQYYYSKGNYTHVCCARAF